MKVRSINLRENEVLRICRDSRTIAQVRTTIDARDAFCAIIQTEPFCRSLVDLRQDELAEALCSPPQQF